MIEREPHETPVGSKRRIRDDIARGFRCARCWLILPCHSSHPGAVVYAGAKRGEANMVDAQGPGRGL